MNYFPVHIPISNKKCIVIGAGNIAFKRTKKLYECGADITVIAPSIHPEFKTYLDCENITYIKDTYHIDYIVNADFIVAGTDNVELNQRICQDAKAQAIMVNSVTIPCEDSVIIPASTNKEGVVVSATTSGQYPVLSQYILEKVEEILDEIPSDIIEDLTRFRKKVKSLNISSRKKRMLLKAYFDKCILFKNSTDAYKELERELNIHDEE